MLQHVAASPAVQGDARPILLLFARKGSAKELLLFGSEYLSSQLSHPDTASLPAIALLARVLAIGNARAAAWSSFSGNNTPRLALPRLRKAQKAGGWQTLTWQVHKSAGLLSATNLSHL